MRFSAVHKVASYLMVACAYGSLAFSGELSILVVSLGALMICLSWFFEPPRFRPERWTLLWNALAIAAFGYTILSAFSGGEWVVPGANLLLFLLVAKLFNRRTSRDYQVVYVLSFLMLVAGTTLNAEISYALCFLGYVVFATWALILFHLRREMEDNFLLKHVGDTSSERVEVERILNSRRIVGGSFLAITSMVSLFIFLLSATMFFLFPRLPFGIGRPSRSHMTFAGFSDGVSLGGHGLIRNDDTVVMRVKVSEKRFQGSSAPELHWRGAAFDRYSHGKWSRSTSAFGTHGQAPSYGEGTTRIALDAANRVPTWHTDALRQDIYLEPLDATNLFSASTPLAFELDNVLPGTAASMNGHYGLNDELHYPHTTGLHYVTYSDPDRPSRAELSLAADADPVRFAAYLKIPNQAEMPARVAELGRTITAGLTGPYAKAEAVERYLLANYTYTLQMETDDKQEPLDYFLFTRKKGHCEYFSSAMAILLRASGVPTRNVNGFLGGEWNEYGKYIAVRGGDAHSWVEVWFDGIGWVTYDPTPSASAVSLTRGGGGALDKLRRILDNLRLSWFKWVMEYDLNSQVGLLRRVVSWFGFSGGFSGKSLSGWVKRNRVALIVVIVLFAGLLVLRNRWRRRRQPRSPLDAMPAPKGAPHAVVTLYERSAKTLARLGFPRSPGQTPREHAAGLVGRAAPGAEPFAQLTELYYTVRFAESAPLIAAVDLAAAEKLAADVKIASRVTPRTR